MSSTKESKFDLEVLLGGINKAFLNSAEQLRTSFDGPQWRDEPYVYHMPKMQLSIQLTMSYSDGKVKGFFSRKSSKETQELTSTINIDVVAVPRPGLAPPVQPEED